MTEAEIETYLASLDNVQREENYGYTFFFVGDDHMRGFVTIAHADDEYDNVSNLNRDGVFRVNIGVSKETFKLLLGDDTPEQIDYAALNVFLPHPHYAKQHFISILNPSGENADTMKQLIIEAHQIAAARRPRQK